MNDCSPPRWAVTFLRWFVPPKLYESIEGDLLQQFEQDLKVYGRKAAKRRYVLGVIGFFRPAIILRNSFAIKLADMIMWRSYLVISIRSIMKSKSFSLINIAGLSIGIASCLLILNYIRFELSFDRTHPDVDRLYRVNQTAIWTPGGGIFSSSGPQLAFALMEDFPEVEAVTRINTPGGYVVRSEKSGEVLSFREDNVLAADSNFFSFFDFKLKEGNPQTALTGVNKVILSDVAAKKFFGNKSALGEILTFNQGGNEVTVQVSGVLETQPENVHFHFDYLLSMYTNSNVKRFEWSFIWSQVVTYLKVKPNTDVVALEMKMQGLGSRRIKPTFMRLGMDYDDFLRDKGGWSFYLQPVKEIRLYSAHLYNRYEEVSDIKYLYIFGGICLFVLLIAAINFINLATARASMRAREVGVKKALGAVRRNLVFQFQFESILLSFIATLLAVVLMTLLGPAIFLATGFNLPVTLWSDRNIIMAVLALPFVLGILAGWYPSYYLTSFRPIEVLKGKVSTGIKSGSLRSVLVVVQFAIAIGMMVVTLVVQRQLKYMSNMNLGLNKENVLLISHAEELGNQISSFRDEIASYPGVMDASIAMNVPGRGTFEDIFGAEGSDVSLPINMVKIDSHQFNTLGLKLAAGREFSSNDDADAKVVIVNENTVKLFGWTNETAIGHFITYPGLGKFEIIGVVKDFHFRSLRVAMSPLIFFSLKSPIWGDWRVVAVKYKAEDVGSLRNSIEQRWSELVPASPPSLTFYEDELEQQYQNEKRLAGLFSVFTAFSIGVGIIGLIGLVSYAADQERKQIGIRKVFGASRTALFIMMNARFVKLMTVAALFASPVAWWMAMEWLDGFAYHAPIGPSVFAWAILTEIGLSVLCVSSLTIRAASLNPAEVLREQ